MEKSNRLTLKKIADMVGVDKAIVSKVINHNPKVQVNIQKRRLIEEIVLKNHYTPLSAAQSLATHRTRQLAFLLSSTTPMTLANGAFSLMLCGVEAACRHYGYQCQVCVWDFADIESFAVPENLKRRSIDGCLLSGGINDQYLQYLAELEVPVVALGGESLRGRIPVLSHRRDVEYEICIEHIRKLGHRHIWLDANSRGSLAAYRATIARFPDLQVEIISSPRTMSELEEAEYWAECFWRRSESERPTIIFCNDLFCCRFGSILQARGVAIPEQVNLLSYSDTLIGRSYSPPLSSFSQDFYQIGQAGVKVLTQMLEQKLSLEQSKVLADQEPIVSTFIERGSTSHCKLANNFSVPSNISIIKE